MNDSNQPSAEISKEGQSKTTILKAEAWRGMKLGLKWSTIVVAAVWVLVGISGVVWTYFDPSIGPKSIYEFPYYAVTATVMVFYFYCMALPVGALAGAGLMSISALWPAEKISSDPFE